MLTIVRATPQQKAHKKIRGKIIPASIIDKTITQIMDVGEVTDLSKKRWL